ncbi:MAG: 23S rRNA (guanosine(2251)-2'-O)-methyltransferase RlmB [Ruminococcus sp.]|jgi:23S rRNA (guanosine2251-2'-O)-methyltransferase|nr:23S rRNA (guanosine(2251)-2'-O)-methyltransferase RlmB [Ruminococcus sp.]
MENNELIIGRNPVMEALKSEREIDILYIAAEDGKFKGILGVIAAKARESGIPVKTVDNKKLDTMAEGMSHQGVIATAAQTKYLELDELLAIKKENPIFIACAGIEDPHNLGAIIRTAEAAGVTGIIIPKRRNVSVNATVMKTSAGAAAILPVCRVGNLASALDTLKENGVWIYGADMEGESAYKTSLTGSICFVIGAEGDGLPALIRKKCDVLISLPMKGQINSLNASVAAGIIMFEAVRQRGK